MCEACPIIDWEHELPTIRSFTPRRVTDAMTEFIIWYDRYEPEQKPLVGGKNASLGEMMRQEMPVPPGFALTTDAYAMIWRDRELVDRVNDLLRSIDHDDLAAEAISERIRARIKSVPVPDEVVADVAEAYAALSRHCEIGRGPILATADLPDASFAGQQDTFLWITGVDAVVEHVRRCWSSIFTDGRSPTATPWATCTSRSRCRSGSRRWSTRSPRAWPSPSTRPTATGPRSPSTPRGARRGRHLREVTPDNFLVDKVLREVVSEISDKAVEYRLADDGSVVKADVEADRRSSPSVTDADLVAIAILARRAEQHYGCPQDVEWAVDRHLPRRTWSCSGRPETVWSQKAAKSVSSGDYDPMASIVSTLVSPLHNQQSGE